MIIVAIDPGKQASWARHDTRTPHLMEIGDVECAGVGRLTRPCPIHIGEIVADADIVIVEEVSPQPHEGVVSSFTFGLAFGSILTAVQSTQKALRTVTPKQWSVVLKIKPAVSKTEKKAAAVAYVKELWPGTRESLKLVKHHNRADAALMIKWFLEKGPGRDVPQADVSS